MSDTYEYLEAEVKTKNSLTLVWIIPLVALAIGAWMFYEHWQNQGVEVTVTFESAEGLEPGKTKVKSRNVDIGTLRSVHFTEDRSRIVARLEIDKNMTDFLATDSQFWIVKPRIGANGISGIGTILSGAYIEVYPGTLTKQRTEFKGLERPPITELDALGLHLVLASKQGVGLSVGDPILYRGFTVGHIQTYSYDTKAGQAKYDIFIESPYDSLVTSNSHFWNTGGISVKSSAQGFSVDVGTLETLISGGIAFDVPEDLPLGEAVTKPRQFTLYKNRQDVTDKREYQAFEYVVRVDESVRGLYKGAPVQYRGIRVGSVSSPYINFTQAKSLKVDEMDLVSKIAVVIRIEPERLLGVSTAEEVEAFNQEFKQSIKHGLTASIETANLISGSLMVNLDFNGEPLAQLDNFGPYTVIPSTVEGFNKLTDSLANILETMEQLPLQELVVSLNSTLQSADAALRGADQTLQSLRTSANQVSKLLKSDETAKLTANVNASLREMRKVLKGLQPESSAYREVQATLYKMQKTLDELQPTLKKIGNNPSAIIFSTPRDRDLEPKKK